MSVEGGDGEVDIEPYDNWDDTGPFCRHFCDPADCSFKCLRCGHECHEHDQDYINAGKCNHDDCACEDWVEKDG